MEKIFHRGNVPPLLFAVFILILSVIPSDLGGGPPSFYFPGMDKVIHAGMYGTFSLLVLFGLIRINHFRSKPVAINLLLIFTYSALMELLQYLFIASRSGEWRDLLANLSGILLSLFVVLLYRMIFSPKS